MPSPHILEGIDLACKNNLEARILPIWRDIAYGNISFIDLLRRLQSQQKLLFLTVDSIGVCDLHCADMCYYHPKIDTRRTPVDKQTLMSAIKVACEELSLKTLILAGKEPLLNIRRVSSLTHLTKSLSESHGLLTGIVTNGRSIEKHWQALDLMARNGSISFLDVSIDSGIPEKHDDIRGINGTFKLAFSALKKCATKWPWVRVGVASVLRHDNIAGLLELINLSASFNRYFFIAPIHPPVFSTLPTLSWQEIQAFLHALIEQLETKHKDIGLEIIIQLPGFYVWDAATDGLFDWQELQEDTVSQIFAEREIAGNRLILQLQIFPETGWRTARITYDGAYLPNAHFLQHPHPEEFAVGYIQQESIVDLYRRAIGDDSVFATMLNSRIGHACRNRPCWHCCFGGLVGSESSIISGSGLNQQPRLCLKTDSDFIPVTPK